MSITKIKKPMEQIFTFLKENEISFFLIAAGVFSFCAAYYKAYITVEKKRKEYQHQLMKTYEQEKKNY